MKNLDFSNLLFSVFSPEILIYPVKNSINPITVSVKDLIHNSHKLIRPKSALNINQKNLFPKNLYNKCIIEKGKNLNKNNKNNLYTTMQFKHLGKKSLSHKSLFFGNDSTNDFKPNNYRIKIRNKALKNNEEPYKKYLSDRKKIETIKKLKELEHKYIMDSKIQKALKLENDIRNKFQGLDFSKQKKRDSFIEQIVKSKIYDKQEEKKKSENSSSGLYNTNYFLKMINFELNQKRYMFLENNKFIPSVKYNDFKERYKIFTWNLKENPNYSTLINYISNK